MAGSESPTLHVRSSLLPTHTDCLAGLWNQGRGGKGSPQEEEENKEDGEGGGGGGAIQYVYGFFLSSMSCTCGAGKLGGGSLDGRPPPISSAGYRFFL